LADRKLSKSDYEKLADFRYQLRKFLRFSEEAAQRKGITMLQYLLMLEFLLICVRLVLSGYCVWAFFGQDRKFPHTFIAMSSVMMATVLVDAIVLQYAAARDGIPAGDQNLVVVLAAGALWIAYMLISQRVRATFVGDDGEDYRSRRVPRELVVPP